MPTMTRAARTPTTSDQEALPEPSRREPVAAASDASRLRLRSRLHSNEPEDDDFVGLPGFTVTEPGEPVPRSAPPRDRQQREKTAVERAWPRACTRPGTWTPGRYDRGGRGPDRNKSRQAPSPLRISQSRRPSERSSKRARRSSSRSRRTPSVRRARGARATSRFPAVTSFTCPPSNTSASRSASAAIRSAHGCARRSRR